MAEESERDEPTQQELTEATGERLREAAKWLVGAFAAVGAALIAGSQLSSIGRLTVCAELTLECTRLWWAILGAVVGLGGVAWAIWIAVDLLTVQSLPPSELQREWRREERSAVYRFFRDNPLYLQGFRDFADVEAREREAYGEYDRLSAEYDEAPERRRPVLRRRLQEATEDLEEVLRRSGAAVSIANQVSYIARFRRSALRRILVAASLAATGIGVFAWAANPPEAATPASVSLRGAALRGADLSGVVLKDAVLVDADLRDADLTGADLTGADLVGAKLDGVTWSSTTCPDGSNSDDVGGTCLNHLSP